MLIVELPTFVHLVQQRTLSQDGIITLDLDRAGQHP